MQTLWARLVHAGQTSIFLENRRALVVGQATLASKFGPRGLVTWQA